MHDEVTTAEGEHGGHVQNTVADLFRFGVASAPPKHIIWLQARSKSEFK
jgi:hypothetical protein